MPSALLTADSAKLSIVAINPDKLRVSYRDGTVDRSTMIIRAALRSRRPVFFHPRRRMRLRGYASCPFARLRGWGEEASRPRPSPSNTEYYLGTIRITPMRDRPLPGHGQCGGIRPE